jgi:hypothetical protein
MASNGRLPPSDLGPIAQGQLRKDAAAAWNAMNVEARRRGVELLPNGSKSSYRTYAQQVELYALYKAGGNLAAVPGNSNHGWGLAVDVATPAMRAMIDHIGPPFGWSKEWSDAPSEWWHLKYREGTYRGPDPGPYGEPTPAPPPEYQPSNVIYITPPPGGDVAQIAVMQNKDGRIEVFVLKDSGEVFHKWQTEANKSFNDKWASLGKP